MVDRRSKFGPHEEIFFKLDVPEVSWSERECGKNWQFKSLFYKRKPEIKISKFKSCSKVKMNRRLKVILNNLVATKRRKKTKQKLCRYPFFFTLRQQRPKNRIFEIPCLPHSPTHWLNKTRNALLFFYNDPLPFNLSVR